MAIIWPQLDRANSGFSIDRKKSPNDVRIQPSGFTMEERRPIAIIGLDQPAYQSIPAATCKRNRGKSTWTNQFAGLCGPKKSTLTIAETNNQQAAGNSVLKDFDENSDIRGVKKLTFTVPQI